MLVAAASHQVALATYYIMKTDTILPLFGHHNPLVAIDMENH